MPVGLEGIRLNEEVNIGAAMAVEDGRCDLRDRDVNKLDLGETSASAARAWRAAPALAAFGRSDNVSAATSQEATSACKRCQRAHGESSSRQKPRSRRRPEELLIGWSCTKGKPIVRLMMILTF